MAPQSEKKEGRPKKKQKQAAGKEASADGEAKDNAAAAGEPGLPGGRFASPSDRPEAGAARLLPHQQQGVVPMPGLPFPGMPGLLNPTGMVAHPGAFPFFNQVVPMLSQVPPPGMPFPAAMNMANMASLVNLQNQLMNPAAAQALHRFRAMSSSGAMPGAGNYGK